MKIKKIEQIGRRDCIDADPPVAPERRSHHLPPDSERERQNQEQDDERSAAFYLHEEESCRDKNRLSDDGKILDETRVHVTPPFESQHAS